MANEVQAPTPDLAAIRKQVESLDNETLKAKLLSTRVRQKVQIAKSSVNAKAYGARQREREKQMKQLAIDRGLWDSIEAEAEEAADAKIAELGIGAEETQ